MQKIYLVHAAMLSAFLGSLLMHHQTECAETRPRSMFFEDVMGISEKKFRNNKEKRKEAIKETREPRDPFLKNYPEKKALVLQNLKDPKKTYQAGYFEELSLQDLYTATKDINKGGGTLSVIERVDGDTKPVDIGTMQADSQYQDAVFQVASNFNGLEFSSKYGHEMQNLEAYIHDHTQGPFASISAAPGLIQRQYYIDHSENTNPFEWAQRFTSTSQDTKEHQVNFLDQTDIPTTNGYVDFSQKKPNQLTFTPTDYRQIKVGFQGATQVTFGRLINFQKHETVSDPSQVINQVFTAAVDYTGNNKVAGTPDIAKAILQAAYEGTLRAAAFKNKKKVVLTLIGGGVFNNDFTWIKQAIVAQKNFIQKSGLDVTLIIFNSSVPGQDFLNAIEKVVQETGGSYIRYSKNEPTGKVIIQKKITTTDRKVAQAELTKNLENLAHALQDL